MGMPPFDEPSYPLLLLELASRRGSLGAFRGLIYDKRVAGAIEPCSDAGDVRADDWPRGALLRWV